MSSADDAVFEGDENEGRDGMVFDDQAEDSNMSITGSGSPRSGVVSRASSAGSHELDGTLMTLGDFFDMNVMDLLSKKQKAKLMAADENKPIPAEPVELPSQTRLKITLNKIYVTAEWKWAQGGDDTCGICRMPFEACCVDCKAPGDECPLVVGAVCRHPFHMHCIEKWTQSQNQPKPQCPLCRQEWNLLKKDAMESHHYTKE